MPGALEVQADAADQAGILVALGGMTDEVRRLVDEQQVCVFVDDLEEFVHSNGGWQGGKFGGGNKSNCAGHGA